MNDQYSIKKEQIKKAAIKCFGLYGFGKTTLEDIAGSVGIKKNSLYYYYESKEQLFYETVEDEGREIINQISAAVAPVKANKEKVQTFLKVFCKAARKKANLYSIKANAFLEFGIVIEKADKGFAVKLHEMMAGILREGIRQKEFVQHDCEEFSHILIDNIYLLEYMMMFRMEINLLNEIKGKIERDMEKYRTKTISYLLKGIAKK